MILYIKTEAYTSKSRRRETATTLAAKQHAHQPPTPRNLWERQGDQGLESINKNNPPRMIIVLGRLGIWMVAKGSNLLIDKATQGPNMNMNSLVCFAKAKGNPRKNNATKQQLCESVVRCMHASKSHRMSTVVELHAWRPGSTR
jgi:hypothetical protein